MCPFCLATLALAAASVTSTGVLMGLGVSLSRRRDAERSRLEPQEETSRAQ